MDTPIVIIILAYIASFALIGIQVVLGDPLGIEIEGVDGIPIRDAINTMSDTFAGCYDNNQTLIGGFGNQTYTDVTECFYADQVYQPTEWIEGTNSTFSNLSYQTAHMQLTMASEITITDNPLTTAATLVYQIFQIITGTYIFNLLKILWIPDIFVAGISMIYVILISIWTIKLLRGNNVN
jgi:hypothetical protein